MQHYRHADWLGSIRLVSTPSRTVSGDTAYAPFGYAYAQSGSPALSFTGQGQNTAANLYDFMYREYGIQGRWPSPDPLDTGAFNLADPQTFDLYAYVRNSPMSLTDPLGLVNSVEFRPPRRNPAYEPAYLYPWSTWDEFDMLGIPVYETGWALMPLPGSISGVVGGTPYEASLMEFMQYHLLVGNAFDVIESGWLTKPAMPIGPTGGAGGGGATAAAPPVQAKKGLFTCASDAAESVSIAADLHNIPGLKSGVGGFVVNALAGNPFSGATDLISSFGTGEGGGHNVFYNMALADAAGPTLGFGPLFGNAIEGTPWAAGPTDALLGLFGEYATGIGEANFVFSGITYGLSLGGCTLGWIH